MKVTLKQLSGTKFRSVKINVLKIPSAAKLYRGIRRYFAKQRKIDLFYLITDSRILQCCLCQQLY